MSTGPSKVFICTTDGTIRTFKEEGVAGSVPKLGTDFTYTGSCEVIDDSNEVSGVQWRIKFKTSGILTFTTEQLVDVFIVNGGKAGTAGSEATTPSYGGIGGNGGNGGGTGTFKSITITPVSGNTITIAGSTGASSAFGKSVSTMLAAGRGGTGGNWTTVDNTFKYIFATNGSGGAPEFGDPAATYYAGGGGGGGMNRIHDTKVNGAYGSNGGGQGGASGYATSGSGSNAICKSGISGSPGTANTGGGGGGGGGGSYGKRGNYAGSGGSGGSGIVIIRKHKD